MHSSTVMPQELLRQTSTSAEKVDVNVSWDGNDHNTDASQIHLTLAIERALHSTLAAHAEHASNVSSVEVTVKRTTKPPPSGKSPVPAVSRQTSISVYDANGDIKSVHNSRRASLIAVPENAEPTKLDFAEQDEGTWLQALEKHEQEQLGRMTTMFGFSYAADYPTNRTVTLETQQLEGRTNFQDELTCTEHCGCDGFTRPFHFVTYAIFTKFFGVLVMPIIGPMALFVMAGKWEPPAGQVFVYMWVIWYGFIFLNALTWALDNTHFTVLTAMFKNNPAAFIWLGLSRITYTICSAWMWYSWENIVPLVAFLMYFLNAMLMDSQLVTVAMRSTSSTYNQFFKGSNKYDWFVQMVTPTIMILLDVSRHCLALYLFERDEDADICDPAWFKLSIGQRAYQVTLKDVTNATFSVAVVFYLGMLYDMATVGSMGTVSIMMLSRVKIKHNWHVEHGQPDLPKLERNTSVAGSVSIAKFI